MEVREPSANDLVPAAFKQSEAGVIPADWNAEKLGIHANFRTGPFGSSLHQSDYVDDGVPVINPMQIADGKIVPTSSMCIDEATAKRLSDFRLTKGEIVIGRRGEMGRCAVVVAEQNGWLCGTGSMIVRCKDSLDARFAQRVLSSPQVIAEIVNTSVGTTMINLNQGTLSDLYLPIPPTLHEQQAIATALSDADALIESLEQLLAKKRQIKQGAMQELLTAQRRLPGFEGDWSDVSLLQLANGRKELFDDGDWIEAEHITAEGIRLIQTGNIGVGTFLDKAEKKYIFESSFRSLRCKELQIGDLLICRLAEPAGRACVLPDISEPKMITSVDVTIFRPPETLANRVFLANLFSMPEWFREVSDRSGGTTHKRIARGALGRLTIRIPDVAEQTAIAEILSDMDADIAAVEAKLAKARAIKQGMMQELLTGRIRLVPPAAEVIPFPGATGEPQPEHKPHNVQFEEAALLGMLAGMFGSEKYPLARVRRTKLLYLLHRRNEGVAAGYLKKAAGPYNPKTRYEGGEGIALKRGYVRSVGNGQYDGLVAGDKLAEAEAYVDKWHGPELRAWLERFRFDKTEALELLATVDMAMVEIWHSGRKVSVEAVRQVIAADPEWRKKLEREIFSDEHIAQAMARSVALFGEA